MSINNDSVSLKISTDAKETNTNLDGIITRLDKTISCLEKISGSTSFKKQGNDIKTTKTRVDSLNNSLSKIDNSLKSINKNTFFTTFKSLISGSGRLGKTMAKLIDSSASYVENLNLLQVAFGETGSEFDRMNESFVNGLADSFGLDESVMTRQLGYYRQIGNALRIDADYADMLAKNLLKMQLDMSSLYNLSFEKSGEVLQSSMAGQTKPIRGATGADITQGTLQTDLDRLGIDVAISDLTRAEKVLLIYLSIQNQIVQSQGDLAKTINSTANQQKIFSEQCARLARVLGSVLYKEMAKFLQVANGVLMVVVELVEMFAKLVGFEIPEYETGTDIDWLDELDTGLGDANDKAKELKKSLRGFDKLNVINTPSSNPSGTSGLGSNSGVMNDLLSHLTDYDLLMSKMENNATRIRNRIMEWLGFTGELNPETGEMEWKYQGIDKTLENVWNSFKGLSNTGKIFVALGLVSTFSNLFKFGKKLTTTLGKGTGLTGIIGSLLKPTKDLFGNMLTSLTASHTSLKTAIESWREQQGIIDSTTGKVNGFKGVMAGVGTALKGLTIGVTGFAVLSDSIKDANENGLDFANTLGMVAGNIALIAGGATAGSVFGLTGTVIGGVAGALTGLATTIFGLNQEVEKGTSKMQQYAQKLRELNQGAIETTLSNSYLYDSSVKLTDELGTLLDANGKVKEGEEERAQVILTQLNEALGTEYTLEGNVIKQNGKAVESYQEIKKEINELIKVKRKQNVLDAYSAVHQENLKKAGELTSKITKLEEERNKALEKGNDHEARMYNAMLEKYKENKEQLLGQIDAYDNLTAVIASGIDETSEEYQKALKLAEENGYEFVAETIRNSDMLTENIDANTQEQSTYFDRTIEKISNVGKELFGLNGKDASVKVDINTENFNKDIKKILNTKLTLDALLKLKTDSSNVTNAINSITKSMSSVLSKIGIKVEQKANGGFPEDGWFRASKGELMGQFDDGTSIVANNRQVVAGVREMLKDGMMDALMMSNANNKQDINVTIVAEDNDMLNGIKFKEKQRDRQYGF